MTSQQLLRTRRMWLGKNQDRKKNIIRIDIAQKKKSYVSRRLRIWQWFSLNKPHLESTDGHKRWIFSDVQFQHMLMLFLDAQNNTKWDTFRLTDDDNDRGPAILIRKKWFYHIRKLDLIFLIRSAVNNGISHAWNLYTWEHGNILYRWK